MIRGKGKGENPSGGLTPFCFLFIIYIKAISVTVFLSFFPPPPLTPQQTLILQPISCFILNMSMVPTYPKDRTACMIKDGPVDPRFQVPGGTLCFKPERDSRFPYIYEIPTHALVHSPKYIKTILIHIVDTSMEARKARAKFEFTLTVPLGPNACMENHGTLS